MAAIGEARTIEGRTVKGSFIPLREVASRVGVHHSTILNWYKKRKVNVRGFKNSRKHWVFREEDVDKFIQFHRSVQEV